MNQAERNTIVPKCTCCKCYSSNVAAIMLKLNDLSETADNLLRFVNERADAEEAAPLEPAGPVESDAVTAAANLTQVFRHEQQRTRALMTAYFVVVLVLFMMLFLMLFLLLSRQGQVPATDTLSPPSPYDTILCCAKIFM